jgi:hypothetical protein
MDVVSSHLRASKRWTVMDWTIVYPKKSLHYGKIGTENIIVAAAKTPLTIRELQDEVTLLSNVLGPINGVRPEFNKETGETKVGVMEFRENIGINYTRWNAVSLMRVTSKRYRKLLRTQRGTNNRIHGIGDPHRERNIVIGRTFVYLCQNMDQLKALLQKDLPHVPAILRQDENPASQEETSTSL